MKRVHIQGSWPASWKYSYSYDLEEIYGEIRNPGYAYSYSNRCQVTLRLLSNVLKPGARVLDIAAGQGNFALSLAELGYKVTWNDLRGELIDYVKLKHERGEINFVPGNIFEINIPYKFDAVLITEIIEHVAHPDEFLKKSAHLVKPGGYIVMTTPNGKYIRNSLPKFSDCKNPGIYEKTQFKPDSDGHIFLLYPDEIVTLAADAGLEIEEVVFVTNH